MKQARHSIPLIGTVGWDRADWAETYYPAGLPPDWRLGYYANDCGCVLLDASDLAQLQPAEFVEMLDDAGDRLVVLLRLAAAAPGAEWAACFAGLAGRLFVLAPPGVSPDPGLPYWPRAGEDVWREPGSGRCVVCWDIDRFDLRQLKERVSSLPGEVFALVIGGDGASPVHAGDLRTLLALMGWG